MSDSKTKRFQTNLLWKTGAMPAEKTKIKLTMYVVI